MTQSNFSFLTGNWVFLSKDALMSEKYAQSDPRAAAIYARRSLEIGLKWVYENDSSLIMPYNTNLAAMIHEDSFKSNLGRGLFLDIKFIHRIGNIAAHETTDISMPEGIGLTKALHSFLGWLVRVYTKGAPQAAPFQQALLPKSQGQQNTKILKLFQDNQEKTKEATKKLSQTEEELEKVKAQLAELQIVKAENQKTISVDEYSEAETRELIIDIMLREAGWDPKGQNVGEYEVHGMPTASGALTGKGFVDYVLWGDDGKPVAIVEAKRTKVDAKTGGRQAELYANCLEAKFKQRPIIYYSNGYTTWLWDDQFYPPREVQGFATRDELQWKINQRVGRKDLQTVKAKPEIAGRYYQLEAAGRVMEAFDESRKRKSLIVMATGAGKTRLSISIVDIMLRAGWVRKVLFLADRIALVHQAKRSYTALLPHVTVANLLEDKDEDARIVFSTYPTMLNCIDGTRKDQKEVFSSGHFDLIIIDEAHRSVYQKYGAIFDYFDSLLLGLTATPRDEVDRNTYKLFELDDNQPTFSYELDQAIADEFLVPPRAISVPLKFQREGIKYNDLSADEQTEYELVEAFHDKETGELVEEIGSSALNKWLFNKDTVNKVLAHLMENGLKVEGGDKLGKTIVFAKNSKHAEFIVEQFDMMFPQLAGKFCRQVDYSVKYVKSLIDDFEIRGKDPQIAVSVDMLDTGIDVPEVVNLVFFKMVRSKTKFWQMIGRGTRLCPDLFFVGDDKKEFLVFDYCQNFEFFSENPSGYTARAQESLKQTIFKRRLDLVLQLKNTNSDVDLRKDVITHLHSVVSQMDTNNFLVRQKLKSVEIYSELKKWDALKVEDFEVLALDLSGLPIHDDSDEYARRFDLLCLNLQLAVLNKNNAQLNYIQRIKRLASGLEEKGSVPLVAAEMKLLLALQEEAWWCDITLLQIEDLRQRLRSLAKFFDNRSGMVNVFTNFEDEIGEVKTELNLVKADVQMMDYKKRVQRFISDNKDHLTINRLINNRPISRTDVSALEDILFSEDGPITRDEYEDIYGGKPLGVLVRATMGLKKNAAKEVFAKFLSKTKLLPDQITFLNQIIDYLIKNGTMDPKIMFETPFTNIDDEGLTGLFDQENSETVVKLVKAVNQNTFAEDGKRCVN